MEENKTKELQNLSRKRKSHNTLNEIKELVEEQVKKVLLLDPNSVKKNMAYMTMDQAKIGMTYIKDREMMERSNSGQIIRVVNFFSSNSIEKRDYMNAMLPELSSVKQIGRN